MHNSILVLLNNNWLTLIRELSKFSIIMNLPTQPAHLAGKVPIKHKVIYEIRQAINHIPKQNFCL